MSERVAGAAARSQQSLAAPGVETGVDVVDVSRIERLCDRADLEFVRRVFTPAEIDYCESTGYPAEHYAGRWCVKEAVRKILDDPGRVPFREIGVGKAGPKPTLELGPTASDALEETIGVATDADCVDTAVSLTHDRTSGIAVGFVTVVRSDL